MLPLVVVFFASVAIKWTGLLTAEDGGALLRVVFYVGVPPLIFLAITQVEIDAAFLRLCLLVPCVTGVSLLVILLLRRSVLASVDVAVFGPFVTGVVVMNTGFLLPFVERVAGAEGLARLAVVDTINGLVTFSLVYAVVVRLAHDRPDLRLVARKVVASPPLWALVAAIVVKLAGATPPVVLVDSFELAARLVAAALLVALGLKFELRVQRPRLLLLAVVLRFGLGLAVGWAFVEVMDLDGLDAGIALFASVAPIGLNSITFAELERLDVGFAASQVSVGLLIAMVASPLTTQLLL